MKMTRWKRVDHPPRKPLDCLWWPTIDAEVDGALVLNLRLAPYLEDATLFLSHEDISKLSTLFRYLALPPPR